MILSPVQTVWIIYPSDVGFVSKLMGKKSGLLIQNTTPHKNSLTLWSPENQNKTQDPRNNSFPNKIRYIPSESLDRLMKSLTSPLYLSHKSGIVRDVVTGPTENINGQVPKLLTMAHNSWRLKLTLLRPKRNQSST